MPSHNSGYSFTSNSSHFNSISASMNRLSLDSTSCNWKNNVDIDGLIKVPMPQEDGVSRLVFYLHGQNQDKNGSDISRRVCLIKASKMS